VKSAVEKQIEEEFSLPWQIYRVATHELGGLHLIKEMKTKYTVSDLYDMLEMLDAHDALKKIAYEKAEAEAAAKRNQK